MSNFSNLPISHYKVLSLPQILEANSVYYVLDQNKNIVEGYITSRAGVAIPLFNNNVDIKTVESVTGTGVTGTSSNPRIDIATFVSSQLNNQIYLSSEDGKLQVNPITSPDGSLEIVSTGLELQIQLSSEIVAEINASLKAGDNVSELFNDGDGTSPFITRDELGDVGVTYTNPTPTITALGGIPVGATFEDKTMKEMWDSLLYPELNPSLGNPYNSLSSTYTGLYEVGIVIPSITLSAGFNRGSISPAYGTSGFRSGEPDKYIYAGSGVSDNISTALTDNEFVTNYKVLNGANNWSGQVSYKVGDQPLTSSGNPYSSPLPAGITNALTVGLTGTYPVFYGKSTTQPVASQALINELATSKSVVISTGTVNITFNASSEYIWFAIPVASTDKTKWFTPSNNFSGGIGLSPSDLFANDVQLLINSPTGLWTGINYRIYISNVTTGTTGVMELRNS